MNYDEDLITRAYSSNIMKVRLFIAFFFLYCFLFVFLRTLTLNLARWFGWCSGMYNWCKLFIACQKTGRRRRREVEEKDEEEE
jgi:hypothetical protein